MGSGPPWVPDPVASVTESPAHSYCLAPVGKGVVKVLRNELLALE